MRRFDGGRLSSDGGVLVLREIEKRLGLAARLAGCLSDARDPASTTHSYADMIGARMFAIACGYEDCGDLDVLRFDPAFKLACGRLPESGRDLISQPTLSRLENAPSWRELARMGLTMIDLFCDSFERVPQRIVLDIDDTPDAVHGGQQLARPSTSSNEAADQAAQRHGSLVILKIGQPGEPLHRAVLARPDMRGRLGAVAARRAEVKHRFHIIRVVAGQPVKRPTQRLKEPVHEPGPRVRVVGH